MKLNYTDAYTKGIDEISNTTKYYLYKGQTIPVSPKYGEQCYITFDGKSIELLDFVNFTVTLEKGDKLYYVHEVGDFDCANSYKLYIQKVNGETYIKHILGVVNVELSHPDHFNAAYIMYLIGQIIFEGAETTLQTDNRKVDVIEAQLPKQNFYLYRWQHSNKYRPETYVEYIDGKYAYNGNVRTSKSVAFDIYHNYCKISLQQLNQDQAIKLFKNGDT
jgi:hypothetical protein